MTQEELENFAKKAFVQGYNLAVDHGSRDISMIIQIFTVKGAPLLAMGANAALDALKLLREE